MRISDWSSDVCSSDLILGELRGPEAFAFLRAINTGHPGSMTTIHGDSVDRAFEQLALLVLEGGSTLQREDILAYVRTTRSEERRVGKEWCSMCRFWWWPCH